MSDGADKPEADRPCKSCGAPLKFARNRATGARIPLDLRAQVYRIVEESPGGTPVVEVVPGAFVTHYATCPQASTHSKKRR